jgi:hypothetical protein
MDFINPGYYNVSLGQYLSSGFTLPTGGGLELGFEEAVELALVEKRVYGSVLTPFAAQALEVQREFQAGQIGIQEYAADVQAYQHFSISLYGGGGQQLPPEPLPGPSPVGSGEWGGLLLLALGAYALARR